MSVWKPQLPAVPFRAEPADSMPPLPLFCEADTSGITVATFDEDWPKFWLKRGKESALRAYEKARKRASREDGYDLFLPKVFQGAGDGAG
jgi:hypothetical protein